MDRRMPKDSKKLKGDTKKGMSLNPEKVPDCSQKSNKGDTMNVMSLNPGKVPDCSQKKSDKSTSVSEQPLYKGSKGHTNLSLTLAFNKIIKDDGLGDECFDELLSLIKDSLPVDNTLPGCIHEAKKLMASAGTSNEKTHP